MTGADRWQVEFYADQGGRELCREWADGLSPQKRAAFTAAVRLVLARRGLDVVETEYGKALGGGLYEFRVRWSAAEIRHKIEGLPSGEVGGAAEAILLRVFFCAAGRKIIVAERLRQRPGLQRSPAAAGDRSGSQAADRVPRGSAAI